MFEKLTHYTEFNITTFCVAIAVILVATFILHKINKAAVPKLTRTDADIKVAVRAWANPATRAAAEITYGHISDWETSFVTNMEKLFNGYAHDGGDTNMQSFNDDISRWDTSNVTSMVSMFFGAYAFNGDLSRWDTSNVTTMDGMFSFTFAFNGDLSRWDTSKVTTMEYMFNYARAFNGDLSRWDTSKVTNMMAMFYECPIETEHKPPRCR